jgi:hypothetical protein
VIAAPDTPRVHVTLDENGGPHMVQAFAAVPIPSYAQPSAGTDHHLAIYQPSTDSMWEFWHLRMATDGTGWHAGWGGRMLHVSTDPGYYRNAADPSGNVLEQSNWGAPATSLPLMAGTMMISELQAGVIPHAIAFAIGHTCAHEFVVPAQRTDGDVNPVTNPTCVPEGAHFRLDPKLNLASLNLPHFDYMVAVAAQKYGMILDNRTSGVGIYDENPAAYIADWGYNPYFGRQNVPGSPGALYDAWPTAEILQFPWSHLQLLPMSTRTKADPTTVTEAP